MNSLYISRSFSTYSSSSTVTQRPPVPESLHPVVPTLPPQMSSLPSFSFTQNFIPAEPIPSHLRCPSCFQIYMSPVLMDCGHIVCQSCSGISSNSISSYTSFKDSSVELSNDFSCDSNRLQSLPLESETKVQPDSPQLDELNVNCSSPSSIVLRGPAIKSSLEETLRKCSLCRPQKNEFNEIVPPEATLKHIQDTLSTLLIQCKTCREFMLLSDFEAHCLENDHSSLVSSPMQTCSFQHFRNKPNIYEPSIHTSSSCEPIISSTSTEQQINYFPNSSDRAACELDPLMDNDEKQSHIHNKVESVAFLGANEKQTISTSLSFPTLPYTDTHQLLPGIFYEYLPGKFKDIPHVSLFKKSNTRGILDNLSIDEDTEVHCFDRSETLRSFLDVGDYAVRFLGYFEALQSGYYTFYLCSNDGSMLWIHGTSVIENGKQHYLNEVSNTFFLEKGIHPLEIHFFHSNGKAFEGTLYKGIRLDVQFEIKDASQNLIAPKMHIPNEQLWHDPFPTSETAFSHRLALSTHHASDQSMVELEYFKLKCKKLETKLRELSDSLHEYEKLNALQIDTNSDHSVPLALELNVLKKLYFNTLVLSLKFEYKELQSLSIDELWEKCQHENVLNWPSSILNALISLNDA